MPDREVLTFKGESVEACYEWIKQECCNLAKRHFGWASDGNFVVVESSHIERVLEGYVLTALVRVVGDPDALKKVIKEVHMDIRDEFRRTRRQLNPHAGRMF